MALSRPRGSRTRLAVLLLVAVTLLVVDERESRVIDDARETAASVLGPVRDGVERAARPLSDGWSAVAEEEDDDDVRSENQRLRDRVAELEANEVRGADAIRQLEELTETLDLSGVSDVPAVATRVTSGPRSNLSHAIEIDKGSDDGIKVGMPAVTSAGLVGRVSLVSSGRATVELLTSTEFRVGVRLAESGQLGTARGQGRDESLVVDSSVAPGTSVSEGTGVVTSGVDRSAYPSGIPVGQVTSTREGAGGLSLELLVEPLVDVDALSSLAILLWEPPA